MKQLKWIDSTALKLLAMVLMFADHTWAAGVLDWPWLTAVGRLAFPIFAFQIAEGCAKTHSRRSYFIRMLIFALISEIPFNFMIAGGPVYPFHQNVLFTFLIAMLLIFRMQRIREKHPDLSPALQLLGIAGMVILGYVLGFVTFVDYFGFGVVTVLLFWLTREQKFGWLIQLAGMYLINWVQMGGQSYIWHLFGQELWIPQQGLAMLALIPIWMYSGNKGRGGRAFRIFGYAFYPAHIAILVLLSFLLNG